MLKASSWDCNFQFDKCGCSSSHKGVFPFLVINVTLATVLRTPNSPKSLFVALICISLTMRCLYTLKSMRSCLQLSCDLVLYDPSLKGSLHRSTCWRVRTHSLSVFHWGKFSVSRAWGGEELQDQRITSLSFRTQSNLFDWKINCNNTHNTK